MTSERTAVTRIDPSSQKTMASTPAPAAGAEVPRPTIPEVELQAEIGRGGMGVVYRGRQTYLDRNVAVKLLLVDRAAADDEYVKRFQREAKILAGLAHPHIVACYSAGITADRHPYLVMEFIDGPNLKHWIAEHGPLKPEQALRVVRELAQALGHAHQNGIIHRDVKPENVLLMKREGDTSDFPFQAKLVDLGLARPQGTGSDMNLTGTGQVMGTPTTMAPEQFDDPDGVDYRADIYGLGCVLYHALIGRPAFEGRTLAQIVTAKVSGVAPNPTAVITGLSPAIGQLVADMLAKSREARPQSYEILISRCDALIGGKAPAGGGSMLPWVVIGGVGVAAAVIVAVLMGSPAKTPVTATTPPATATTTPPVAPAATTVTWGEPRSLWRADTNSRLVDWKKSDGAMYDNSHENDDGIVVVSGVISRPLEAGSWVVTGMLAPGVDDDTDPDEVRVGFTLENGNSVYLNIGSLGKAYALQLWRGYADTKADPVLEDNANEPISETRQLKLEFTYKDRFLTASYNGIPFKRQVGLPGDPVAMFISVKPGSSPLEVESLSIRQPAK